MVFETNAGLASREMSGQIERLAERKLICKYDESRYAEAYRTCRDK